MSAEGCDRVSPITPILGNFSRLTQDLRSGVNIPHSSFSDLSQHVPLVPATKMNHSITTVTANTQIHLLV